MLGRCCGHMAVVVLLIAAWIAYDPRTAEEMQFAPIPRVKESELSHDRFERDYLMPGHPVIIVPDGESFTNNTDESLMHQLLRECGDRRVPLMSRTTDSFLDSMDPPMYAALSMAINWLTGITLKEWRDQRQESTLKQLHAISERDPPSLPLVIRAARSVPLLRSLVPFVEVALRPPYLSDVHPERLKCPAVLESEEHGFWIGQTPYETWFDAELERRKTEGLRQLPLMKDIIFERAPKFFWGGAGTCSYPVHRDLCDADAFFTTFHGCKEFVMIKPEQRHHLRRIDLSGIAFWSDQVFDSGRPWGVARDAAWQGTVYSGETLYMPGEVLHIVRNTCPSTVASCRRPWRASAVRNITNLAREVFRESQFDQIVERNYLFKLYDKYTTWKGGGSGKQSLMRNLDFRTTRRN